MKIALSQSGPRAMVLMALVFLLPASCLAGDTVFGDLEQGLVRKEEQEDQAWCDRGIYSKSFDCWIKAYVNGRESEAEKDWAGVLKSAKGASNLARLVSNTCTRLEFLEGEEGKKFERRGGAMPAIKTMLVSTEHVLGENSIQAASVSDYLGTKYSNCGDFPKSVLYARKALKIKERLWGKDSPLIFGSLVSVADKEFHAKDYANARAHAERGLAIAVKTRSASAQYQAKTILSKLAKVTSGK
jgi:hypothetical protein